MKKVTFLCCLFCGLITQAIGATYNCKPQSLGPLAFKSSNEYLFLGDSNYDDKIALVCGHHGTDGCRHGTVVFVVGKRVHKNSEDTGYVLYRCNTKGGSSWHWLGEGDINKCSGQDWEYIAPYWDDGFAIYGVRVGELVEYEGGYYTLWDEICFDEVKKADTTKDSEKKPEQGTGQTKSAQTKSGDAEENADGKWREPCSPEDLLKVPHAKAGRYIFKNEKEGIVCAATECNDGYYLVRNAEGKSQGWCREGTDPYATTKASETTSGQGAKQTTIADEAKKAGKDYYDPCLPKHFPSHATAGRYIYKNAQEPFVCAATACKDGYYLVRNAEGKSQGWCQYGKDPYATTNASETTSEQGASSSDAFGTGATGADATGAGTFVQNQPSGGTAGQALPTASVEEKSPCELNQSGWLWFEGECITDAQHQNILAKRQAAKVRALAQKIESTASQLDSMSSKFKVSVWKDAEGKFNTARLASDSIAGVVLGTAGGLITSHVVKKNQVENGFQDIKCTIGGQSVANWGDEFSVGIQ